MGNNVNSFWWQPDLDPNEGVPWVPKHDPMIGFPNGRKERVMIATDEEMISANVPLDKRDFCAHLYIAVLDCKKANSPWYYKCKNINHAYLKCQMDDHIIRMKEMERQIRLDELQKKQNLE